MAWGACNLISTRTATASPTISARGAGSSSCSSRTCVGPVGGGGGRRASPLRRAQKAASSEAVRGRQAVTTLEETERIARRVFGRAHPTVRSMEISLRNARAALRARETPPPPPAPLYDEY